MVLTMNATNNKLLRVMVHGSLRLRLTAAVVLIVLVGTGTGMVLDYRREYRVHMNELSPHFSPVRELGVRLR